MAGWIKMPFGTEVGLSPGHIVECGSSVSPPPKGAKHTFWPMPIVAKRSPISANAVLLLVFTRHYKRTAATVTARFLLLYLKVNVAYGE